MWQSFQIYNRTYTRDEGELLMLFILKDKNGIGNGHKLGKDYIWRENQKVSKCQNCDVQWVLGARNQIKLDWWKGTYDMVVKDNKETD